MSEFHDDDLAAALGDRAGPPVATGDALAAVTARSGRIRRRRAVAAGSATVVVAVLGLVALSGRGDERLAPADTVGETIDPPTSTSGAPTTAAPTDPTSTTVLVGGDRPSTTATLSTSTTPAAADPTSTIGTTPSPSTTTPSPVAPTTSTGTTDVVSTDVTTTVAGTPAPSTTTATGSTVPGSTSPAPTSTTTAGVDPFERVIESTGGSITVRWDGSTLSLLAVTPNPGVTPEIERQEALRIRVRFRSDEIDARIDVRIEDGDVRIDVE